MANIEATSVDGSQQCDILPEPNFVANIKATSVDGSQQCDILPKPACRELSDGTKVN